MLKSSCTLRFLQAQAHEGDDAVDEFEALSSTGKVRTQVVQNLYTIADYSGHDLKASLCWTVGPPLGTESTLPGSILWNSFPAARRWENVEARE